MRIGRTDGAAKTTYNTDNVDREIEQLKNRQQELREKLLTEQDQEERDKLSERLRNVERTLAIKDNDTYRRQKASVTDL